VVDSGQWISLPLFIDVTGSDDDIACGF